MSKTKRTPGPWKYLRTHRMSSDAWYVITDAAGYGPIIEVGGKDKNGQIAEAKYLIADPEIIEANARLIAAAPELLETCKYIKNFLVNLEDGLPEDDSITVMRKNYHAPVHKKIDEAIAKAEKV